MTNSPTATIERAAHCRRAELTDSDITEMRALLDQHFDGVTPHQFQADLRDKSDVLRVWKDGQLVGFSTLLAYREEVDGEGFNVLFSGDTIMAPECWGSPVLARGWIVMVKAVKASMPAGRCFWLLLSAGFRTYRFLPVFWRNFWPRYDLHMPKEISRLRDEIAHRRFGSHYDANAGVMRFPMPHRLRGLLAVVPAGRVADPHVAFFMAQNHGWRAGDELVCLTEIADDNLTAAGRRMIRGLPS